MRILNKATIKNIPAISPVWVVPAVALFIAMWLVVQARLEKGADIKITFAGAGDIVAGQTLIKLKDVEVGTVKKLKLSSDLKHVTVYAEIDRDVAEHLSENTRFWMATPKISVSGVSNLGTLISGVYIVMDAGESGEYKTEFEGLDHSPAFESDEPGTQYVLQADKLGSISEGSPLYFRQIRVGEVTRYELAENSDYVDIHVFVKAPYDKLVQTKTRFWNVSGINVSLGAEGLKASMGSLTSLISGGVAFETATGFKGSEVAEGGYRFQLYPDQDSVQDESFNIKYYYQLKFSGSVKGLLVGAPVEFRGLKVGEVVDIELTSAENIENSLHVFITLEPQRFKPDSAPSRQQADDFIEELVKQGLRARMVSGNFITGAQLIELQYIKDVEESLIVRKDNYSEFPVFQSGNDELMSHISNILAKVEAIPIDDLGSDLAASMASLKSILHTLEKNNTAGTLEETLKNANQTINEVEGVMRSLDQAIAPDSELKYELTEMLKSISDAADSVQLFLNELNRHPNALIHGVKKDN